VERFVRSRGPDKKLVLLLNKVDLVPKHAAEAWLASHSR
jgi:ribosome biogenesis GTPase A